MPLFVKAPRQRRGAVDDSDVETTDVLPTIARHLGRVPGASTACRRNAAAPAALTSRQDDGGGWDRRRRLERLRDAAVRGG